MTMYEVNIDSFAVEKAESFAEGASQGITQGIALEKANSEREMAKLIKALIDHGLDLDIISATTGINLLELESIASKAC